MATTRTTKPKPATAVAPTAKATRPALRAARKPRVKAVAPAEPVTLVASVTPVEAAPAAIEATVSPVVEATADFAETAATETPALVEAAVDLVEDAVEPVVEIAEKTTSTVKATAAKAAKVAMSGKKTAEKAVKAGTEKITKTLEQALSTSKEKYETVMQNFSDISAVGRENMDAVVSAGTVFAKGIEAMNAELAAISKRNLEDSVAAVKALAAARSPKEYLELQSDLMKTSWDHMIADTTKIGEMMGEYSKDAMAPLQSRLTAAMEKLSKPLAL